MSIGTLKIPINVISSLFGRTIFTHRIGTKDIMIIKNTKTESGSSGTFTEYDNVIILPPVSDKDLLSKPKPAGSNTGCSISGGKRLNKRTTKKARRTRRRSSK